VLARQHGHHVRGRHASGNLEDERRIDIHHGGQRLELFDPGHAPRAVLEGGEALPLHAPAPRELAVRQIGAQAQTDERIEVPAAFSAPQR